MSTTSTYRTKPNGATEKVVNLISDKNDRSWSYGEIAEATGLTRTQVSSVFLYLKRKNAPIAGDDGVYRWIGPKNDSVTKPKTTKSKARTTKAKPVAKSDSFSPAERQRMTTLYNRLAAAADENGVVRAGYAAVIFGADRYQFRTNGKFSRRAVEVTFRNLRNIGSVRTNGPFVKILVQHPDEILGAAEPVKATTVRTKRSTTVEKVVDTVAETAPVNGYTRIGNTLDGEPLLRDENGNIFRAVPLT